MKKKSSSKLNITKFNGFEGVIQNLTLTGDIGAQPGQMLYIHSNNEVSVAAPTKAGEVVRVVGMVKDVCSDGTVNVVVNAQTLGVIEETVATWGKNKNRIEI